MALQERSKRSGEGAFNGQVSVATSVTEIRAANRKRVSLTLTNDGANTIYVYKGTGAALHKGIRLNKEGGFIVIEDWEGVVTAIAETGTTVLCVCEC